MAMTFSRENLPKEGEIIKSVKVNDDVNLATIETDSSSIIVHLTKRFKNDAITRTCQCFRCTGKNRVESIAEIGYARSLLHVEYLDN